MTVQPAARAWPPPPKAEVIATASARSLVRTLTRVLASIGIRYAFGPLETAEA